MRKPTTKEDIIQNDLGLHGNLIRIFQFYDILLKIDNISVPFTQENYYNFLTENYSTNNRPSNTSFSGLSRHDAIADKTRTILINKLNDKETYRNYLSEHIIFDKNTVYLEKEITNVMVEALKKVTTYYPNMNANDKTALRYNETEKTAFIELLKMQPKGLIQKIYLYLYFSVVRTNCANFYFGSNYEHDLNEFNNEVLCKYGTSSSAGLRAITTLAKKEPLNMFAAFEYGELFYYGRNSLVKNLTKAFEWYFKAAGLLPPTKTNFFRNRLTEINEEYCNPLALWSIAYVMYNYHRNADLKKCEDVTYIEDLYDDNNERRDEYIIQMALFYAYKSYSLNNNGPAANLLGNILTKMTEEDFLYYKSAMETEYDIILLDNPIDYYEIAIKQNYVYGFNNYADQIAKMIKKNPSLCKNYINKYIELLENSKLKDEPWALNKLGLYYYGGEISPGVIDTEMKPNLSQAKEYFHQATTTFIDHNSVWACVNLITKFPNDYKNDIASFERICRKVFMFENEGAYLRIKDYFNNQNCPYSSDSINHFKTLLKEYLDSGNTNIENKTYDELYSFCSSEENINE